MIETLDDTAYERNKDDPFWYNAYKTLLDSKFIFRIRNLIVHPNTVVLVEDVGFTSNPTVVDLDTLELSGYDIRFWYNKHGITGGYLAYSRKGPLSIFKCNSEKPVAIQGIVMQEGSTVVYLNEHYRDVCKITIGTNSVLKIAEGPYYGSSWQGTHDLKIGNNSNVSIQLDGVIPTSLEIGNSCKVLYSQYAARSYINTSAAPKKKVYYRRPNKIKDGTICLLAV